MQESISESRLAGCSLTGALSVVAFVLNSVIVVHGPKGCIHQAFSMLHAMFVDADNTTVPEILVSDLSDRDIIFGGERSLLETLDIASAKKSEVIFVLTSCIPETIGDDVFTICSNYGSERIIYIPTSGFLGGGAKEGENVALISIGKLAPIMNVIPGTVAIIGEKNLESEVDENYAEVERLLKRLNLRVIVRFCRNENIATLMNIGSASCFILRDDRSYAAGIELSKRFQRPIVSEFPRGLSGCIRFLQDVGTACKVPNQIILDAVVSEEGYQEIMLQKFSELSNKRIRFGVEPFEGTLSVAQEVAKKLNICECLDGTLIRLPFYLPIGTAGVQKMLYLWRRVIRNE